MEEDDKLQLVNVGQFGPLKDKSKPVFITRT